MKVKVGTDLKLNPVYADLSEFIAFPINIDGYVECNHFLLSLCHQLDLNYAPQQSPDRAPWKYTPIRESGKNLACVTVGTVCTSIGIYTIAYTSRNMENIDTLYIYNILGKHIDNKGLFKVLIKDSIKKRNEINEYVFSIKVHCIVNNITSETYIGKNFCFTKDEDCFRLLFRLNAIDNREAFDICRQRVRHFLAFMAIETNLFFHAEAASLESEKWAFNYKENKGQFFHDYIDTYSIKGNCLMISSFGYEFIDKYIFTDREATDDSYAKVIIAGGEHIYEGIRTELNLGENLLSVLPNSVLMLKKVDAPYQIDVTKSLMSYMSALEVATINEGKPDRCKYCNTELYHISHRIKDIATRYLSEDLGKVYSKLYSLRSKYLHAGKFSTDFDQVHIRPVFSHSTNTGLVDAGFISLKMSGRTFLVSVMNVKEWTTYCLRCYYQEKLFSKNNFDGSINENDNATDIVQHLDSLPLKISSVSSGIKIDGVIIT